MRGLLALILTGLLGCAAALAQTAGGIAWSYQVQAGVEQARRTHTPLMFWVVGRTCDDEDRVKSRELKAFADRDVLEAAEYFVPVRLSRSAHADQLKTWGINPRANLIIVFSTPEGEKIDVLYSSAIVEPESLVRKMILVVKSYRQSVFDNQVKPVLEDPEAKPAALTDVLDLVERLSMTQADELVIALLERSDLDASFRGKIFLALARLSTPASVDRLLEAAREEDSAAEVLRRCTPDAAERMLDAIEGDYADLRPDIYEAAARIVKLPDVRPRRFWDGATEFAKNKEIKRLRELVTTQAERWRKRHDELR